MMKKALATLLLSGIVLAAWTGSAADASAAEMNISAGTAGAGYEATQASAAEAHSTAEFTIDPGKLTLDKVSDLHFSKNGKSNPQVADFIADQDLTLDGQSVTSKTGEDGNSDKQVIVSDFRGSHDGWTLNVKMTPFVNANNNKDGISGSQLTLDVVKDDTKGKAINPLLKQVVVNQEGNTLINADSDQGTFTNTFDLTGNLHIPAAGNESIQSGTYQSTVTWTLLNTKKAEAAS